MPGIILWSWDKNCFYNPGKAKFFSIEASDHTSARTKWYNAIPLSLGQIWQRTIYKIHFGLPDFSLVEEIAIFCMFCCASNWPCKWPFQVFSIITVIVFISAQAFDVWNFKLSLLIMFLSYEWRNWAVLLWQTKRYNIEIQFQIFLH